jgi:hypothetical protein
MTRARLPNRPLTETIEFNLRNLSYTASVGRYLKGNIAELFLSNHESDSAADTAARDAAIAFSFAVQHGTDPDAMRCAACREGHDSASSRWEPRSICSLRGPM